MSVRIQKYEDAYIIETMNIWNEVIEEGVAFPHLDFLDVNHAGAFFKGQTYTGIAIDTESDHVLGLYILHPNNVGRCGHIANASYAVSSEARGFISEKNWYVTAWRRQEAMVLLLCSSMQL